MDEDGEMMVDSGSWRREEGRSRREDEIEGW